MKFVIKACESCFKVRKIREDLEYCNHCLAMGYKKSVPSCKCGGEMTLAHHEDGKQFIEVCSICGKEYK